MGMLGNITHHYQGRFLLNACRREVLYAGRASGRSGSRRRIKGRGGAPSSLSSFVFFELNGKGAGRPSFSCNDSRPFRLYATVPSFLPDDSMRYSTLAQAAIIAVVAAPVLALPVEIRSFEPENAALIERELLNDVVERADYDDLIARDHQKHMRPKRPRPTPPPQPTGPAQRRREDGELLYEREYDNDLVARSHQGQPQKPPGHPHPRIDRPNLKLIIPPHPPAEPKSPKNPTPKAPTTPHLRTREDDEFLYEREFDELAEREYVDDLIARGHQIQKRMGPKRPRPTATPSPGPKRPKPNPPPHRREDGELLYGREYDNDLVARSHQGQPQEPSDPTRTRKPSFDRPKPRIRLIPSQAPARPKTPPPQAPTTSHPHTREDGEFLYEREYDDELFVREIDELN
ncbi:uncharacterized protein B0H18DRAFT_507366 [Fomitopsis serialis]|uniref:uncharacterized protein n=1 Tax=Fomitopsis serialis TaxID=139415 RepID=UPI002007A6C4|nr:uncharacterized protein B0H18DRAFT_507366 [Neoantrodia serialis]KAH9922643.1 hypothetical protein B0H18DRAFT_507366 [Neoantrodia serialis]